jgi:hypothetical protein
MNNGELILAFEGRDLCSRVRVLVAVDRTYQPGEIVELEIVGVVNRGELASDDLAGEDDVPPTLRTGCSPCDTFVVCGEVFEAAEPVDRNMPTEPPDPIDDPAKTAPYAELPEEVKG